MCCGLRAQLCSSVVKTPHQVSRGAFSVWLPASLGTQGGVHAGPPARRRQCRVPWCVPQRQGSAAQPLGQGSAGRETGRHLCISFCIARWPPSPVLELGGQKKRGSNPQECCGEGQTALLLASQFHSRLPTWLAVPTAPSPASSSGLPAAGLRLTTGDSAPGPPHLHQASQQPRPRWCRHRSASPTRRDRRCGVEHTGMRGS